MPATGQTYIIAGAGISGLTLSLTLAKFGATVVVLERNETVQEAGAGLQISPNARRVLDRLGLSLPVEQFALEPRALDTYRRDEATPFFSMEFGPIMEERFGAPYAVMHRADLADALYKASRRFANIDIMFGVRRWDVVSHARGVTVSIDEANGQARTTRANAFIGADGVHSQTRREALGGADAHFEGRVAWRTLVPADSVAGHIASDSVSVFFGAGHHLVAYPLPHRRQVNLALFLPGGPDPDPARPSLQGKGALGAILAAAGSSWTPWPLYTVQTKTWHRGNIGLVGDAAHAMVPFQAQGAAMGIEDAAVLGPLLIEGGEPESAFARYAAMRQDRVERVAKLSASNGRIFHMRWPMSLARDRVMQFQGPRAHLDRLGWIYGHDAGLGDFVQ
ncbi:salicylate hydroxylase [Devosia crocina]|uniref:Salicylate hydroxylase n=1 Tax=Devosia crocina TaxID=429728 RepID=A0A1I7N8Z3_9HYPH|nr:FAD-dependent monooxygenase [Devosia crocina]SFV31026.1 salicylate hydroxylase [Devosia crocina]